MRLSEKTIEINICSQLYDLLRNKVFWFGLTQKQEARAGFDVCSRIGGRMIIFQFKASNHVLKNKRRRFHLPHEQMTNLQRLASNRPESVFYVFPLFGETLEILNDPDVIDRTRILNVADIDKHIAKPTIRTTGQPRKNEIHYGDANNDTIIIHSEPKEYKLFDPVEIIENEISNVDWINYRPPGNFEEFWEFAKNLDRKSMGAIVGPPGKYYRL